MLKSNIDTILLTEKALRYTVLWSILLITCCIRVTGKHSLLSQIGLKRPGLYTLRLVSHWMWAVLGRVWPWLHQLFRAEVILKTLPGKLSTDNTPSSCGNNPSVKGGLDNTSPCPLCSHKISPYLFRSPSYYPSLLGGKKNPTNILK